MATLERIGFWAFFIRALKVIYGLLKKIVILKYLLLLSATKSMCCTIFFSIILNITLVNTYNIISYIFYLTNFFILKGGQRITLYYVFICQIFA